MRRATRVGSEERGELAVIVIFGQPSVFSGIPCGGRSRQCTDYCITLSYAV